MIKTKTIMCAAAMMCAVATTQAKTGAIELQEPQSYDFSKVERGECRKFETMGGADNLGNTIEANNHYLTYNDIPFLPSYGEFQFSRYPAEHWEDALIKMKNAGFYGVSAYIFWIHHEEVEGEWNWSGRYDLRRFLELCKKHELKVFARIGPWVNGECRNGGHPDWLVKRLGDPEDPFAKSGNGGRLRSTDPQYMAAVDELYHQLSIQMEGLYFKDGGPLFAIQLDNENRHKGAGRGAELLDAEKEIALKYGMEVPIYTSTGWAGAEFTQGNTLPVYGTYLDNFWTFADDVRRPRGYSFTKVRAENEVDTEVSREEATRIFEEDDFNYDDNPYLTCEIGTGMNIAYHRRPLVDADDDAVVSLVELGCGVNAMGYYTFVGGNNPIGKHSYMNRTLVGGSNDCSVISNDFQAAIGEFGQVRDKYHRYPAQLNFMADFGEYLAPCQTFIPEQIDQTMGQSIEKSHILQQAIRTDGERGFIFVNNHIKRDTTYQFNNVQFEIKLKDEVLNIPQKPCDIAVGSYFYWPFNLSLSGVELTYATAQPVAHLESSDTYLFFQNEGLDAEFVLDNANINAVKGKGVKIKTEGTKTNLYITKAGLDCYFDVTLKSGAKQRIMVITEQQSRQMCIYEDKLYLTDSEAVMLDNEELKLISAELKNHVWCYPSLEVSGAKVTQEGLFERMSVDFESIDVEFDYSKIQEGRDLVIDNVMLKDKLTLPDESYFDQGTILDLSFPEGIPAELYDLRLVVDYEASALRLYKDGKFVYDNYYNGTPWELGARHQLADYTPTMDLKLKFIPLQPNDPIYIAGKYIPDQNYKDNVLNITSIEVRPVYERSFHLK